jgi:hypothetical protein
MWPCKRINANVTLHLLYSRDQRARVLQKSRDETTDRLQEILLHDQIIDEVVVWLLRVVCPVDMPRSIEYNWEGGLAAADEPIFFSDASNNRRRIPIPRVFYASKKVSYGYKCNEIIWH